MGSGRGQGGLKGIREGSEGQGGVWKGLGVQEVVGGPEGVRVSGRGLGVQGSRGWLGVWEGGRRFRRG